MGFYKVSIRVILEIGGPFLGPRNSKTHPQHDPIFENLLHFCYI